MRRVVSFLVRNWPLKLGSIVLASVLYAGLVLSQNVLVLPDAVPLEISDPPAGAVLLDSLPEVSNITYFAPADVGRGVGADDFRAMVDLSGVQPERTGGQVTVPVRVRAFDTRIVVRDWRPRQVTLRFDPVATLNVPVVVDLGTVPTTLDLGPPAADPPIVTVRGASSVVERVRQAVARMTIDASALNVDRLVDLIAVDQQGEVVSQVQIEPDLVQVRIPVSEREVSRSLPVVPHVVGTLPPGYQLRPIEVDPLAVTVSGEQSVIDEMTSVRTEPIDVAGRTTDLETDVLLAVPAGVEILGDPTASISIGIDAETGSRSFQAGLTLVGARPDRLYTLSVPEVVVTLSGPLSVLGSLDPRTLVTTVDVTDLDAGRHEVPVQLEAPEGTSAGPISPALVGVSISAPPTATPSPSPSVSPTPDATVLFTPSPSPPFAGP
ncbi:MAG: hypothetical protein H0V12_02090 [Chloroflexi bacterium]|nr:hypothetical protein [Chloroflexota bacterium]